MSTHDVVRRLCTVLQVEEPVGWVDYFDIVKSWAARIDLTAARTDIELAEILFLDAGQLVRAGWVQPETCLIDVGAGVGAPTIPVLLAGLASHSVLVEPRRKRAAFLRFAAGALHLAQRVSVLEQKLALGDPVVDGAPFGVALSRATFPPTVWLELGIQIADEVWVLTAGAHVSVPAGVRLERRHDYIVPSSGAPRSILAYRLLRAGMI